MDKIDISIIIVNWNARELLKECINSIYENMNQEFFEVIVVDNNSSDGSADMIKEVFGSKDNLIFIINSENKGFAGANNQGLVIARGRVILLLNPDTLIIGDVINSVYKCLCEDSSLGIAGCKVLNVDGTLQLACRRMVPTPKDAFFKLIGISKMFKNRENFSRYNLTFIPEDEFCDVDSVSGAFLMIKREVINTIGLLDEDFFMYGEEMDWCLRAKKAGYKVRYCPVGSIIHYKGESSRKLGFKATYEFYRAMYVFYRKNNKSENNFVFNLFVYAAIFLLGCAAVIRNTVIPNSRVGTKG
jgi:GT2 family glycosyltransferase